MGRRNISMPATLSTLLAGVLIVSGAVLGAQSTTSATQASVAQSVTLDTAGRANQPLPEILAEMPEDMRVNHGKYDNRLTALYEQWLAGEDISAGGKQSVSAPNKAFSPLYGVDVDMSTLTTVENEYQITINPLNSQFAV